MLKVDCEPIHGEVITAIWGENPRILDDGGFCCDRVALEIGNVALEITVNADTEELTVELRNAAQSLAGTLTDISTCLNLVGHPVGRAWTATNYWGYEDVFMIALGDAAPASRNPAYIFVGAGASISVHAVERLKRPLEFALSMPG